MSALAAATLENRLLAVTTARGDLDQPDGLSRLVDELAATEGREVSAGDRELLAQFLPIAQRIAATDKCHTDIGHVREALREATRAPADKGD